MSYNIGKLNLYFPLPTDHLKMRIVIAFVAIAILASTTCAFKPVPVKSSEVPVIRTTSKTVQTDNISLPFTLQGLFSIDNCWYFSVRKSQDIWVGVSLQNPSGDSHRIVFYDFGLHSMDLGSNIKFDNGGHSIATMRCTAKGDDYCSIGLNAFANTTRVGMCFYNDNWVEPSSIVGMIKFM